MIKEIKNKKNINRIAIVCEDMSKKKFEELDDIFDFVFFIDKDMELAEKYIKKHSQVIAFTGRNLNIFYKELAREGIIKNIFCCFSERKMNDIMKCNFDQYKKEVFPAQCELVPKEFIEYKETTNSSKYYYNERILMFDLLTWLNPKEIHIYGMDFELLLFGDCNKGVVISGTKKKDKKIEKSINQFLSIINKNMHISFFLHTYCPFIECNRNLIVDYYFFIKIENIDKKYSYMKEKSEEEKKFFVLTLIEKNEIDFYESVLLLKKWNIL